MYNQAQQHYNVNLSREPIGQGPYFISKSNTLEFNERFVIIELQTYEAVNQLYTATVRATIPSNLDKKSGKTTNAKTTEEFLASQMLKHVTICLDRPDPTHVPKDVFALQSHFHGIVTATSVEVLPQFDLVTLELRPYFWLLSQQNSFRSFENMDAKEILTKVLQPYQTSITDGKFDFEFTLCDPMSKRIQTLQKGETDLAFVLRIMEEEGLCYFFYANPNIPTTTLVITHKVSNALTKTKDKYPNIKKNLVYRIVANPRGSQTSEGEVTYYVEGLKMSLWDFKVSAGALPDEVKANAYPDYRDIDATLMGSVPQEVHPKSEAFKIQPSFWRPTTHLSAAKKTDKEDYLKSVATSRLARSVSAKFRWSGKTKAYGFFPIWRACDVEVPQRGDNKNPTDYESILTKTHKFYPAVIKQSFLRPYSSQQPQMQMPTQISNLPPLYHSLNVDLFFLNVEDDTFSPPLVIPTHEFSDICGNSEFSARGGMYSATVVAFKSVNDDKTDKNFDVPNMIRVRLPWHKTTESVRARLSTFWAADKFGSLFLPEIDAEVIVAFLDDDPDYPVILGSCYNSKNDYPLDVTKREEKGPFGSRGIIFKDATAKVVYGNEKIAEKDVQQLSVVTTDGIIAVEASKAFTAKATQISLAGQQLFKIDVSETKSSIKIDNKGIAITGTNGDNTLDMKTGGTLEGTAKIKINLTAPTIAANGMEILK